MELYEPPKLTQISEAGMVNKKGTGLMMVAADIPADKEEEFNKWYQEEHLQELMSVPGILNAARYEAT